MEITVDAAGNRTALTYPGLPTYIVNTSYDELGRPKDVKENGTTILASWTYPDRLNATVTYANTTSRTVQRALRGNWCQAHQHLERASATVQSLLQ